MYFGQAILLFTFFIVVVGVHAQEGDTLLAKNLSDKYLEQVTEKYSRLETRMDRWAFRELTKFRHREQKILEKLKRKGGDSTGSINAKDQYLKLEEKLARSTSLQTYIPSLDSVHTSLKFLQQNPGLLSSTKGVDGKLKTALTKASGLEQKFQQAEEIRKFLKERREYLKNQLAAQGMTRELKQLNKQVYYYNAQLSEYKTLLKDHKKAERKALELLSKTDVFRKFMRKNSMLASLFRLPGDPNDPASQQANLAGLQTRAQVNGLIQQQISAGGPNGQQQFQQNLQAAQSQMNDLKNKINKLGSGSSDDIMPEGFRPNDQKTKSFFKRLELGTNIQSQKANGYFPVTSDIGLSLGYKLNDKSIIGIGGSYKVGWGQDIRDINITHQGLGLRSFVEWKIKGSFWLSGGYEMNFRSEFEDIAELHELSRWQHIGLIGLSKVVSLKAKFFKKTKLQLLWDFLSYEQVPKTQPVVFRVGYAF